MPSTSLIQDMSAKKSVSAKKLDFEDDYAIRCADKSIDEHIFINVNNLKSMFMNVLCSMCSRPSKTIVVQSRENQGFSKKLIVKCQSCDFVLYSNYSSPRLQNEQKTRGKVCFDVNRRVVESFNKCGLGHAGIENFCIGMNMNTLNRSYYFHLSQIAKEGIVFSQSNK